MRPLSTSRSQADDDHPDTNILAPILIRHLHFSIIHEFAPVYPPFALGWMQIDATPFGA